MSALSPRELWIWAKALGAPLGDAPPEAPAPAAPRPKRTTYVGQLDPRAPFSPPFWEQQ